MTNVNIARIKKFLLGGLKSLLRTFCSLSSFGFVKFSLIHVFICQNFCAFIVHTCAVLPVLESYFFLLVAPVQIYIMVDG